MLYYVCYRQVWCWSDERLLRSMHINVVIGGIGMIGIAIAVSKFHVPKDLGAMFHVDKYPMEWKKLSILPGSSFFWKKLTLEGSIAFSPSVDFAKISSMSPTRYTFYIRWLADARGRKKKFVVRTGLNHKNQIGARVYWFRRWALRIT